MLGFDDMLIGGRCCIGLIRLINLLGLILFITANGLNMANVFLLRLMCFIVLFF